MTDTKTPPPRSAPATEDALQSSSTPFGDTSLLDLDDPNITGTLLATFDDGSLAHPSSLASVPESAEEEDSETSFAQLWAATLTDDAAEAYAAEPQHHATDHFDAWRKAIERHHLPTAVELLPPVAPPAGDDDDDEETSAPRPTGFFLPDEAPLFFVDEQWTPDPFLSAEHVSQNPFEESVAVLNELSFQNTLLQEIHPEGFFAPADTAQPLFSFVPLHYPETSSDSFVPESAAVFFPESAAAFLPDDSADAFFPDGTHAPSSGNTDAFAPNNIDAFSLSSTDAFALNNTDAFSSDNAPPPQLLNSLWLLDESEEDTSEEIILLEDELPPEEEEPLAQANAYGLYASSAHSFPPKIPPVLSANAPPLLTPAIFYDSAETQWLPPHEPSYAEPPQASADFQTQGVYDVVLYTMSGTVKRGAFNNVDLSQPSVPLQTPEETEQIAVQHIKAVYFMKPMGPFPLPPATGARQKVVFNDGRCVEGQLSFFPDNAAGFFLVPRQDKSPTAYLYINRMAVQEISELAN